MEDFYYEFFTIDAEDLNKHLKWYSKPEKHTLSEQGLCINMDPQLDFWRNTYYKPQFVKDDGHFLYKTFSTKKNILLETALHLNAINQFDQAGLMARVDSEHWIKAGLEFVDGGFYLSCVVTNGFSDWSTQLYPASEVSVRIYMLGNDFVVEIKNHEGSWKFIRICHLNSDSSKIMLGLYACSPDKNNGGSVHFDYLKFSPVQNYHHKN